MLLNENESYLALVAWQILLLCTDIRPVTKFCLAAIARKLSID